MEPEVLAGMLFTLILVAMIGGFILLFPVVRRLGSLLEQRIDSRMLGGGAAPEQIRQLQAELHAVRAELEKLAERQGFTEALLSERRSSALPTHHST